MTLMKKIKRNLKPALLCALILCLFTLGWCEFARDANAAAGVPAAPYPNPGSVGYEVFNIGGGPAAVTSTTTFKKIIMPWPYYAFSVSCMAAALSPGNTYSIDLQVTPSGGSSASILQTPIVPQTPGTVYPGTIAQGLIPTGVVTGNANIPGGSILSLILNMSGSNPSMSGVECTIGAKRQ